MVDVLSTIFYLGQSPLAVKIDEKMWGTKAISSAPPALPTLTNVT